MYNVMYKKWQLLIAKVAGLGEILVQRNVFRLCTSSQYMYTVGLCSSAHSHDPYHLQLGTFIKPYPVLPELFNPYTSFNTHH